MSSASTQQGLTSKTTEQSDTALKKVEYSEPDDADKPMHEDIARLAYAIWERSGSPQGTAEHDWREAEQQILHSEPQSMIVGR